MEDLKKINYNLHTVYQTGLTITGVMLFSFSLGMVQPKTVIGASETPQISQSQPSSSAISKGELTLTSNLNPNGTSTLNNKDKISFDLTLNIPGSQKERIQPGDKFMINFSKDSVDPQSFVPIFSTTLHPAPSFSDLFNVEVDSSSDSIVLTAKQNANFNKIQQFKIQLIGRAQTSSKQKEPASATASFILNGQNSNPLLTQTTKFSVKGTSSGSNDHPATYQSSVAIFGNTTESGLWGSSNDPKFRDNWLANETNTHRIDYAHNQDAMLAYAQLALPSNNSPRSVEWKIWATDNKHPLSVNDALVFVEPNNGMSGRLIHPNDSEYPYTLQSDDNGALVFKSDHLPKSNPVGEGQPTLNITFYVKTHGNTDQVPMMSTFNAYSTSDQSQKPMQTGSTEQTTLVYPKNGNTGLTPFFKPQDPTIDMTTSAGKQFPSLAYLKAHSDEIAKYFVVPNSAGDVNNPNGNNYHYTINGFYDLQKNGRYSIEITATKTSGVDKGDSLIQPAYVTVKGNSDSGGGGSTPVTPVNPVNPVTPDTPASSSSSSSSTSSSSSSSSVASSSSSSNVSTPSEPSERPTFPDYVAKKGMAVYSLKKIGLYNKKNFSTKARKAWYSRKPRVYRPMFVVTGYARSSVGHLRYKVRDVNHLTKNRNKKGYITANWKYVRPVYYAKKHSTVTVINPRGVNAYKKVNLTNEVKHYKQGTVLKIAKAVHYHLTTRYILPNGRYITANRKLVNMGRHHFPKYVRARGALNRYSDVNLNKRNHHYSKRSHKLFKVYGFDYSHANSVSNLGALRYRVAHGYISGNSRLVRVIR